jgi:ASC-1-like (ASCH) protein
MQHTMKLNEKPFSRIQQGFKTFELRLYDEKRRKINLGEEIIFVHLEDPQRTLSTIVTGLLVYPDFESLILDTPASWLGYSEADKSWLVTSMREYYRPEDEHHYGVLGIRIKLT